jgi:molybdopterin-guanine dinucleotide biosynthesis protein A
VAFYGRVQVRYLERETIARFDPEGKSFSNVNTLEDLAAAREEN